MGYIIHILRNNTVIKTERLSLRLFIESDAADVYEYLHDPMVHCSEDMRVKTLGEVKVTVLERSRDGEFFSHRA